MSRLISRALRSPLTVGTQGPDGGTQDPYGSALVTPLMSPRAALAQGGAYFISTNPTIGTGAQYDDITGYSATAAGAFVINNTDAVGGKSVLLDFIRLIPTAIAATVVSIHASIFIDSALLTISAGSPATITPVNVNRGSNVSSVAVVRAFTGGAAITIAAAAASRQVARVVWPTSVMLVGDEYTLQFGEPITSGSGVGLTAVKAAAPGGYAAKAPQVPVIPPQCGAYVSLWMLTASSTKPSFEYEIGHAEL